MEQEIRFCTTPEGVRVAYVMLGEGPPLVVTPESWGTLGGHLDRSHFYRALAERNLLVLYDRSGSGFSERQRTDFTIEADVRDLDAVVDHLDLRQFALLGMFHLGPAAIVYAARHPERVSRLLLYGTYARGQDLTRDDIKASIINMARTHWGMASRTFADAVAPGAGGDQLDQIARQEREAASGETVARFIEMGYNVDVVDLLANVQAPTLVLHRRGDRAVPFRMAPQLTSLLPNARLVTLEGDNHFPWFGDTDAVLRPMFDFLGQEYVPARQPSPTAEGSVTILFTDIESSAALRQRLGDARAQDLVHTHNAIVREALQARGGSEIKHTGDGIMASFPSASRALECAVDIQRGVATHVTAHPDDSLGVYVGLNAGEPIAEEQDLFGTSVDLARRLCDEARPGEILVSNVVRELVAGKGFLFADRGDTALRGFEDPVRLYEVRWRE